MRWPTPAADKIAPLLEELNDRQWSQHVAGNSPQHAEALYKRIKYHMVDEIELSELPPSFTVRVLYPDGSSVVQTAYVDMSVDVAIKAFARRLGALAGSGAGLYGGGPPEQLVLQVPSTGEVFRASDGLLLASTPYVRQFLQHQRVPLWQEPGPALAA